MAQVGFLLHCSVYALEWHANSLLLIWWIWRKHVDAELCSVLAAPVPGPFGSPPRKAGPPTVAYFSVPTPDPSSAPVPAPVPSAALAPAPVPARAMPPSWAPVPAPISAPTQGPSPPAATLPGPVPGSLPVQANAFRVHVCCRFCACTPHSNVQSTSYELQAQHV